MFRASLDVYNLFRLDIGKTLQDKAPSPREALSRLKDVKDYITEAVSARFRALTGMSQQLPLTGKKIADLARQTLQQTLQVFEEYVA